MEGTPLRPADPVGGYTVVSGEKSGRPESAGQVQGTTAPTDSRAGEKRLTFVMTNLNK